jgi:peptidoglycan-associated lipoprotein
MWSGFAQLLNDWFHLNPSSGGKNRKIPEGTKLYKETFWIPAQLNKMGVEITYQRRLIMAKKSFGILILLLCLGLFLTGCHKKTVAVNRDRPSVLRSEGASRLEADRAAREAREAQELKERELARIKEEEAKMAKAQELEKSLVAKKERGIEGEVFESKLLKDIHFDFDKYDIRREDEEILRGNAAFLKKNPKMKIQIEGHCDERGTAEYNLALGERRAISMKRYLVSLGIPSDRILTISYGEERPLDLRNSDEAWANNRRAHIVVLSK